MLAAQPLLAEPSPTSSSSTANRYALTGSMGAAPKLKKLMLRWVAWLAAVAPHAVSWLSLDRQHGWDTIRVTAHTRRYFPPGLILQYSSSSNGPMKERQIDLLDLSADTDLEVSSCCPAERGRGALRGSEDLRGHVCQATVTLPKETLLTQCVGPHADCCAGDGQHDHKPGAPHV